MEKEKFDFEKNRKSKEHINEKEEIEEEKSTST